MTKKTYAFFSALGFIGAFIIAFGDTKGWMEEDAYKFKACLTGVAVGLFFLHSSLKAPSDEDEK